MSQSHLTRALVAASAVFAFALPASASADPTCTDVNVVIVRGTAEPAGGSLAFDSTGGINSSTGTWTYIREELESPTDGSTWIGLTVSRKDISYPAYAPLPYTVQNAVADSAIFRNSVRQGTENLITHLNTTHASCPDTRFVLLGYSQGAIVVANALTADLSQRILIENVTIPTLDPAVSPKIAAVDLFADVGFNQLNGWTQHATTAFGSSAPGYLQGTTDDLTRGWNDGNSSHLMSTAYVRPLSALATYKGRIRSYCIKDDFVCQGWGGSLVEHLYYGNENNPVARRNAAIFAIQQVRKQVDKTYNNLQCQISSSTNAALTGTNLSLSLRFKATVNDRATVGTPNPTTDIWSGITMSASNAALLQSAIGNATAIRRTNLSLPLQKRNATTGVLTNAATLALSNVSSQSFGSTLNIGIPGAGYALPSVSWTSQAAGVGDLSIGTYASLAFFGQSSGSATVDCDLSAIPSTPYAGRHFGRVITE